MGENTDKPCFVGTESTVLTLEGASKSPRKLIKTNYWPHPPSFWFSSSEMGPIICLFYKFPHIIKGLAIFLWCLLTAFRRHSSLFLFSPRLGKLIRKFGFVLPLVLMRGSNPQEPLLLWGNIYLVFSFPS